MREALRGVIDPELGSDIVELGMVPAAELRPDGTAVVTVALTTAGCPLGAGVPESVVKKAKDMSARHEASFKKAHKRGVWIAMGTDAGTPFNYHGENAQELERMVALGMSPMEAILSATASAAALLGLEDRIGTIQPGKQADLIIVEGNPLKRIGLLRDRSRLAGVMLQGRLVSGPLAGVDEKR